MGKGLPFPQGDTPLYIRRVRDLAYPQPRDVRPDDFPFFDQDINPTRPVYKPFFIGGIGGWEQHHQGRTIEELCEQILGVVPVPKDRQSQTKWTVKLTWFHNTVCGELEQDATEEPLMRWLSLLEDLDACGWLLWGSAVLAWLYRQMCRITEHGQRNLGGRVSLMLSWAYHRIPLVWPDGFDARRFSLVDIH
ncbi:hypothetical protein AHAS_Ahas19G0125100 [Arachis hypogaea]